MATCATKSCRCHAMTGQLYCFNHSQEPEVVAKRQAARSKGGRRGKVQDAASIDSIDSIDDLKTVLVDALNELRGCGSDNIISKSRAIAVLVNVAAGLIKDGDMEQRIQALEENISMS